MPMTPPTEAPAIAPLERVARATADCIIEGGLDVGDGGCGMADDGDWHAGSPTATRFWALEAWACQRVISWLSLSTSMYADGDFEISFALVRYEIGGWYIGRLLERFHAWTVSCNSGCSPDEGNTYQR